MPRRVAQIADGIADVLDDRRLDALGRLIEDEQFGLCDQRTGDGELLLLTTRKIAAAARQHVLQHREQPQHLGADVAFGRGKTVRPVLRFSSTVSSGKISRPCGT